MSTMTVKQKQWQLYYLGYYGESIADIDGKWGKNSIKATKAFQLDAGLYKDGIFGPQSINKSILVIKAIQKLLGGLLQDGLAGQMTMTATRNYQTKNNLTVTCKADKDTRSKMSINMKKFGTTINNTTTSTTINTTINTTISGSNITSSSISTTNKNTGTWWDSIKYFTRDEFRCKCGGRYCNGFYAEPSQVLVKCADQVREYFDAPVHLTSGLRCPTHNANEGVYPIAVICMVRLWTSMLLVELLMKYWYLSKLYQISDMLIRLMIDVFIWTLIKKYKAREYTPWLFVY